MINIDRIVAIVTQQHQSSSCLCVMCVTAVFRIVIYTSFLSWIALCTIYILVQCTKLKRTIFALRNGQTKL